MRIAFSILHNAEHHLLHNNWAEKLASVVDIWVMAVGATLSGGSTAWCRLMPDKYHGTGLPVDDTLGYLEWLDDMFGNIRIVIKKKNFYSGHPFMWDSKDQQVNAALDILRMEKIILYGKESLLNKVPECIAEMRRSGESVFLWEIDMDEQWKEKDMREAERMLIEQGGDTGMFLANFWVGKELMAFGDWGEGKKLPYRRLWLWHGQHFRTHEPPVLDKGNGKEILFPQRFNHYAYYFDQDVRFKNDWYRGHEKIYPRWLQLNAEAETADVGTEWPVSRLITGNWGKTNTVIRKVAYHNHKE